MQISICHTIRLLPFSYELVNLFNPLFFFNIRCQSNIKLIRYFFGHSFSPDYEITPSLQFQKLSLIEVEKESEECGL